VSKAVVTRKKLLLMEAELLRSRARLAGLGLKASVAPAAKTARLGLDLARIVTTLWPLLFRKDAKPDDKKG
jgi:hypothetical protein